MKGLWKHHRSIASVYHNKYCRWYTVPHDGSVLLDKDKEPVKLVWKTTLQIILLPSVRETFVF